MSEPSVRPQAQQAANAAAGDGASAGLSELDALRKRVETAEQERQQFLELSRRTQADFENYQKRSQRDAQQEKRYWYTPLAQDLLPALDNLDRATIAAKQVGETGPLVQGVTLVQSQLLDIFRRHGITPIEAIGQPFDPNRHEAVMQRPADDVPANTVLDVLQRGFLIHDRVLRPAAVVVSVPAEGQ